MDHQNEVPPDNISTTLMNQEIQQQTETDQENDDISITSKEIMTYRLDINPNSIEVSNNNNLSLQRLSNEENTSNVPKINKGITSVPVTNQPLSIFSNLPSPMSLMLPSSSQPQSLFLQALSKLNMSSLSLAVTNYKDSMFPFNANESFNRELSPPDSLTSAPPSYSFVLRQMVTRRRPRLMGTFIQSPSFIQHTPPPNYATAFDIYVDSPIPAPPTRIYNFGFTPMPIICPQCGHAGMTVVASRITICTHLCAISLCLLCCWICAPLPYVLRSCKNVYHYCRSCRSYLGMYCPTNPDIAYA